MKNKKQNNILPNKSIDFSSTTATPALRKEKYSPIFNGVANQFLPQITRNIPKKGDQQYNPQISLDEIGNLTFRTNDARNNDIVIGIDGEMLERHGQTSIGGLLLYFTGITGLTKINNLDDALAGRINSNVEFSLKEYALHSKADITPNYQSPKILEAKTDKTRQKRIKAEEERANNVYRQFKKRVLEDLGTLGGIYWSGTETYMVEKTNRNGRKSRKRETRKYAVLNMISTALIDHNDYIVIRFNPDYVDMLVRANKQTMFLINTLAISKNNPNAIRMFLLMQRHYTMNLNHPNQKKKNVTKKPTYNRLKIKTLLAETDLPPYEKVLRQGRSWRDRIKEPFEKSLDELVASKCISNYYYGRPNNELIPDEEADFETCKEWEETLLYFELVDEEQALRYIKDRK